MHYLIYCKPKRAPLRIDFKICGRASSKESAVEIQKKLKAKGFRTKRASTRRR